mmetsp:Transcript_113602/g.321687  ORF Transcript_113602/g.321687 Transcript_113602/m.321687 type:complete len:325 (-) Transcript_113602:177-1151(-)
MASRTLKRPSTAFSHGIQLQPSLKRKRNGIASGTGKGVVAPCRGSSSAAQVCPSSPFPGFNRPLPQEVAALHRQLAAVFGERKPERQQRRKILDTVVGTILSQNTTNTNSHAAFTALKRRFKTWDDVRKANPASVQESIKCGGLAPKKTKWIQHICRTLHEELGKTSMEHLRTMTKKEVHASLERFTGVGAKTAAIINLFDVGHPDMAVDTHVFRYAEQLGWVPTAAETKAHNAQVAEGSSSFARWPVLTRDTAYLHLDAAFPDWLKYSMHLILTDTVGGLPTVCSARNVLSFDGKNVSVDAVPLRKAAKTSGTAAKRLHLRIE